MSKDLEARIAKLEEDAKPAKPFVSNWKPPINPLDRVSMPASAVQALVDNVPDALMADLRADARRGANTNPSKAASPPRGDGWVKPLPLRSPPDVSLCDKLVDAQDAIDRSELVQKEIVRLQAIKDELTKELLSKTE